MWPYITAWWRERRQVFDLPPVRFQVTEHRVLEVRGGCGKRSGAFRSEGVATFCTICIQIVPLCVCVYVATHATRKAGAIPTTHKEDIMFSAHYLRKGRADVIALAASISWATGALAASHRAWKILKIG